MTNYDSCPKPRDKYSVGPEPVETQTTRSPTPNELMANSCVNTEDKCNFISQPFYENELGSKNVEQVKNNFQSMCGLRNGNIQKCCSLTSPRESNSTNPKSILKYGFKVQDHMGLEIREEDCRLDNSCLYKACNEGEKGCIEIDNCPEGDLNCEKRNKYYKCKFNDITMKDINENTNVISNLQATCHPGICKNEEYAGWLLSPSERNNNIQEDKRILLAIKEDNIEVFQDLVKPMHYIKGLTVGYHGNSLLHETIYWNSPKIFNFILNSEYNKPDFLEVKNKDGNTALNLACLKSNFEFFKKLKKFNANLFTHNEYLETPLDSAIRSKDKHIPLILDILDSSNNMLIFNKNIELRNPLHSACVENTKDLEIISVLIKRGADVIDIDKNNNSIIQTLKKEEETAINQEIETLLIKTLYEVNKNNKQKYAFVLAQHNEYSPFVFTKGMTNKKEINFYNPEDLDGIEIDYTENIGQNNLESPKYPNPIKILPEEYRSSNLVEGFSQNTLEIDYVKIAVLLVVLILLFYSIL